VLLSCEKLLFNYGKSLKGVLFHDRFQILETFSFNFLMFQLVYKIQRDFWKPLETPLSTPLHMVVKPQRMVVEPQHTYGSYTLKKLLINISVNKHALNKNAVLVFNVCVSVCTQNKDGTVSDQYLYSMYVCCVCM